MCMCAYVMHLHGQTFSLGYRSRSTYTAHVMYSNCGYKRFPYRTRSIHPMRCTTYYDYAYQVPLNLALLGKSLLTRCRSI